MKLFFKDGKKRPAAFSATIALIFIVAFFGALSFKAHASYVPTNEKSAFPVNSVNFSNAAMAVDYSYYYNTDEDFASAHSKDTLTFAFTGETEIPADFAGIGTLAHPFGGTLRFGGENYQINAHSALFNYVYDSVKLLNSSGTNDNQIIETVVFRRLSNVGEGQSCALLAEHVVHDESAAAAEWRIQLNAANDKTYSGVIGEIGTGANVNLVYTDSSTSNIVSASDVGAICGVMSNNSTLTLSYNASSVDGITSSNGSAGGLVGEMKDGSRITVSVIPTLASSVSAAQYAGGLVGKMTSNATIDSGNISIGGSVVGSAGAGGLFGYYANEKSEFDIKKYSVDVTVYGPYCGGVFGVLENNTELTIKNTGSGNITVGSAGSQNEANGEFGGIIGKYIAESLSDSLILDGLTINAESETVFDSFGGAIGKVASAAYIKTVGAFAISASGTDLSTCFGGLIGSTSENDGVFVDLRGLTLDNSGELFVGGGIVGRFYNGVLRLTGTTDLSAAKCADGNGCGQLVGENDNVLVYALGSGSNAGWTFNRSNGSCADDLGTWGEVVRSGNIETDVLTFDDVLHTVKVKAAKYEMANSADFIATALNIQLNDGTSYDCLIFENGAQNTRTALLGGSLSISADIDLGGTGITGFMRDGGNISDIGSFTGTLDGGGNTITLAAGETYGVGAPGSEEGLGQIYRHQHNGLFASLSGNVTDITVNGIINVRNRVDGLNASGSAAMNIGGIASRNGGNVTLNGVKTAVSVNYYESAAINTQYRDNTAYRPDKNIGGYIGYVGADGVVSIIGKSEISATISLGGYHQDRNVYGGAIGKISAETFTVNIGESGNSESILKNALSVDTSGVTHVGDDSFGGGLIGFIDNAGSYKSRFVNINNLIYDGASAVNAANVNVGGLLGFLWLGTTAKIDGLSVIDAEIINRTVGNNDGGNENIGVMCYGATGKWTVNSLNVSGLDVTSGCASSLGILVNKAYDGKDGLYIDLLNAGFTLSGVTLPSTLGVYDEIAAYSSKNVNEDGEGTGVISVDMNSSRTETEVKTTVTGTYQNKLGTASSSALGSSKYANSNTRYYYNIGDLDKNDDGQDLLLLSLNIYAAPNIKNEFESDLGKTTLSGTADMTGLSFYPFASADGFTIGNLTLTLGYS